MAEIIKFGHYSGKTLEWDVLWEDDYRQLLMCRNWCTRYGMRNVTWGTSPAREYFNDEFFKNAFSKEEKQHIINTVVQTESEKTKDNIFILSLAEAKKWVKSRHISDRSNESIMTRSRYRDNKAYGVIFFNSDNYGYNSSSYSEYPCYPCIYLKK